MASSTAASDESLLKELLSFSQPLHGSFSQSSASSPSALLSLRQLVPVHRSMCLAIARRESTSSGNPAVSPAAAAWSSLESTISAICVAQEETALCEELLLEKNKQNSEGEEDVLALMKRQLVAVQYLLNHPHFQQNPLEGLAKIVLPLLTNHLPVQHIPQQDEENNYDLLGASEEDTPPPISPVLLELLEALLDAAFCPYSQTTTTTTADGSSPTIEKPLDGLRACLDLCLQSPTEQEHRQNHAEWGWTVQGRVLMRLHAWFGPQSDQADLLLQFLIDKCLDAMHAPCRTMYDVVAWLRPMTNEWLPYWLDHLTETGEQQLWKCLWETFLNAPKEGPQHAQRIVSTTSILCVILPAILTHVLPGPKSPMDAAVPFHQPQLWQLIHECLRQGIPRKHETGKAGTTDYTKHHLSQMLRRRGLYLLRLVVQSATCPDDKQQKSMINLWKKYVLVMETMEMEAEQHLIDQIWETLTELLEACQGAHDEETTPPPMTWHWARLLLARIITSYEIPVVRKLAIYRLLQGQAGISVDTSSPIDPETPPSDVGANTAVRVKKENRRKKTRLNSASTPATTKGAPLSILSPAFVCDIILTSFDSLAQSVGTTMHLEEDRELQKVDIIPLLSRFMIQYYMSIDSDQRKLLLQNVWHEFFVLRLRTKTVVQVWGCIAQAMSTKNLPEPLLIEAELLNAVVYALQRLFATGSLVRVFQESLLSSLAVMLAHTRTQKVDPKTILRILALWNAIFKDQIIANTPNIEDNDNIKSDETNMIGTSNEAIHASLQQWLQQIGESDKNDMSWIAMVASTVAAAFVRGELSNLSSKASEEWWEPQTGASELEREFACAVAYLCTLVSRATFKGSNASNKPAGEMLWPAIHKGLAQVQVAIVGASWAKADVVTRALLLLEQGCRWQVLSGMGNGDLIMDRKTQQMMPPPPHIETLLASSIKFIIHHIAFLLGNVTEGNNGVIKSGNTRLGNAKKVSVTFANLISQLQTLQKAYPSSMAVSHALDDLLKSSLGELEKGSGSDEKPDNVEHVALTYAALSSGADLPQSSQVIEYCRMLLHLRFQRNRQGRKISDEQAARSIFYFAKWGALSCLLPILLKEKETQKDTTSVQNFIEEFSEVAIGAVTEVPVDGLMVFFNCVTMAARRQLSTSGAVCTEVDPTLIERLIHSLSQLMDECAISQNESYMLNEICALIFQPRLLSEEYERLRRDPVDAVTPIRDAFRRFIKLAGTVRSHISRAALCHITIGWLGIALSEEYHGGCATGVTAVPYRDTIVDMLLHKETKVDLASVNQNIVNSENIQGALHLPNSTDESSIARGFLLLFFEKLPSPSDGLHPVALVELVQFTIFQLFDKIVPKPNKKNPIVMVGTDDYVRKMRGWQALCCLARFVTEDIAEQACKQAFLAMTEALHGQIRYFIEIFTIRCARMHPTVFGKAILDDITRRDLTSQHVSSLLIVSGNLIVGRYQLDFFKQYEEGATGEAVPLNKVLAGVIPWLGSTQGFSRAIAQLLTHKLIPLVVDVTSSSGKKDEESTEGLSSNWLLRSIYRFLEENPDMKRLRKKQMKFFDKYEVEAICTPEGVLSIPVDEGGEADPEHMVDAIKNCLREVYEEAHGEAAPIWKQIDEMLRAEEATGDGVRVAATNLDENVRNFQRKIIPLDELNIAMEGLREKRLRNIAGIKKQDLIVCASLIDKVPNLGGLARTAEIFAAEKLVVPDIKITKMDNFVNLSVTAGDWIDIEECREEDLLRWLRSYKARGYYIVGLEQTSSSISLEHFCFPDRPVILLLGKEKEGIPVEFLPVVDQCVEIPQMGIIRSLNVHVSGAIAIWEHTRQKVCGKT